MSQWSSQCLSTNSWYYWSPWYSTQTLPSTIPIIIHVISIFVQLLSDENVISFSQNYNHPKYSGKFPHWARDWAQPSSKTSMPYLGLYRVDLRWGDVDCIVNNFYYYLIFILLLLWATLRTETSEESCICEISINLYFCTCLFNFFLILQTLMFIYLKFTPIEKKKPRGVSIVVKGLEAGVFFTGVGSNLMPIFLFSFIPLVTLKKKNYILSYCKPNYVQFWFYFPQIS